MENDISIRPVANEDLEMIRNWRNSPEVSQYMYTEPFISKEDQIAWFTEISADPTCKYLVVEYEGKPLGLLYFTEISKTFDSCFWAFYLGDTSVRGAGIGTKIEYNALSYIFDTLKLNKLRCEVLINNEKVIKMHEKFGFRREAYYREHVKKKDVYYDVVGLAMLRREWEMLKDYHFNRIYNR